MYTNFEQLNEKVINKSVEYRQYLEYVYHNNFINLYTYNNTTVDIGRYLNRCIYTGETVTLYFNTVPGAPTLEPLPNVKYNRYDCVNKKGTLLAPLMLELPLDFVPIVNLVNNRMTMIEELEKTRYSIIIQSKVNTFLVGQGEDSDVRQLADRIYMGTPFSGVNTYFSQDNVITLNNTSMTSALADLTRYEETIKNFLDNIFGLKTAGSEKESGITEKEADSTDGFSNSVRRSTINTIKRMLIFINHYTTTDITLKETIQ